jgi:dynactin 1
VKTPVPSGAAPAAAKPSSRGTSRLSMMADKRKSLAPKAATPKVSRDPSLDKIKAAKAASPPKDTVEKPVSPAKEAEVPPKSVQSPVQTLQEISDQQGKIAALQKENAELQASVKDWKDKTDVLVAKRRQDREALKDAERNRIQLQSFEEFKVRIMEQNKEKLRDLDAARKAQEELQAEFDQFREDMADSSETIEMLTLDKEMAEEAAEIARSEVEEMKIRLEEAETDLEILRAEAESANETISGDGEGVTPLQLRIKDDEIQRLKDAIVKFRDLNAEEKQAAARAFKQSKSDQEELALAKKLQQKFEDANTELQDELIELKEQVDLALGSEEMVENLTIRVLDLEEKLQEEKERADDLDELHELDAEMGEVAREKELELREDNDMINAKLRDVTRKLEAEIAHASDLQETIKKFRYAVTIQKDEIEHYKEQSSRGEGDGQAEMSYSEASSAVLTERVLERRYHSTQVELDLRKLESDLLAAHVNMLQMFLPHGFKTRGGDADGVKLELLIRRLSAKARIIQTEAMDKYDLEASTGDPAQTETDIWAAELVDILETFRGYTETFTGILQDCSIETWKRVATLYHEMVPHEAVLDYFIDLVRRDALDETISLLNLQKSLGFIAHVHGVHFAREQDDAAGFILRLSRKGLTLSNRLGVTTARLQNLGQVL